MITARRTIMKYNYYKIDKLIDEIKDLVNSEHPDVNLVKPLADEYNIICSEVNGDIELIGSMMSKGEYYHALHLAKSDVDLGETISKLSFKGLEKWNQILTETRQPSPPEFRKRGLDLLRELYASQSDTALDDLWDEFRTHMIREEHKKARASLHSILALDPNNRDAAGTLADMEQMRFKMLFEEMAAAVSAGQSDEVWELISKIHPLFEQGFVLGPNQQTTWQQAKLMEVNSWMGQLSNCRTQNNWPQVLRLHSEIEKSVAANRLHLDPNTLAEVTNSVNWAKNEKARDEEAKNFKKVYVDLQDLHAAARNTFNQDHETKDAIKSELNRLEKTWRDLEQFPDTLTSTIAPEINEFNRQRLFYLRGKVKKYEDNRRNTLIIACTVFVGLLVFTYIKVTESRDAKAYVKELNAAVLSKEYNSVTNLYSRGTNEFPNPPASIMKAMNEAGAFMTNAMVEFNKLDLLVLDLENKTNSLTLTNSLAFKRDLNSTLNQVDSLTNIALQLGDPLRMRAYTLQSYLLNKEDEFKASSEGLMLKDMEAISQQINSNFFKPTPDIDNLNNLLDKLNKDYGSLAKYDRHTKDFAEETRQKKLEIRQSLDKQKQSLMVHQEHWKALDRDLTEGELKQALGGILDTGLLLDKTKIEVERALVPFNEPDLHRKLDDQFVWEGRTEFKNSTDRNRKNLYPFASVFDKAQIQSLGQVSENRFIYGVEMIPKTTRIGQQEIRQMFLSKTEDNKWQPWDFITVFNPESSQFKIFNSIAPDLLAAETQKPNPVRLNESFEKGNLGLRKALLQEEPGAGPMKESPFLYLSNLCQAISEEKMEPIIGMWKIEQFIKTLFPSEINEKNGECALGYSVIDYGISSAYLATLHMNIGKTWGDWGEIKSKNKIKSQIPYSWTTYFDPAQNNMDQQNKSYTDLKKRIIDFTDQYKNCHIELRNVRDVYLKLLNDGDSLIQFAGHVRKGENNYSPELLNRNKTKHVLGISSEENDWVFIPKEKLKFEKLLPFTPVYILNHEAGTKDNPLPKTKDDWHQFPKIIKY